MTDLFQGPSRIAAILSHPEEVGVGLPWAVSFASQADLPLTFVHVIDPATSRELPDNARVMAADMLSLLTKHHGLAGHNVTTRVEMGMPEAILPGIVTEDPGTMLLLVGGEHGAFARTLLGRGRENVIRSLRTPFIFLPPRVGEARPVQRIVVGHDGAAASRYILSIMGPPSPNGPVISVEVIEPGMLPDAEFLALKPVLTGERIRMRGRPGFALLAAARAHDAGMIAIGSHGAGGAFRRNLGGTAQWLTHHADRPLMIVPDAAVAGG